MDIDHMVSTVVSHLSDAANAGAVAGEPIELGDVTLVVLSTLSVGMGAAGGEGSGEASKARRGRSAAPGGGAGEGAGGAVKVRPAAVIAFTPEGVEVLTIPDQPGVFDKVVERVPDVVEMVEQARQAMA